MTVGLATARILLDTVWLLEGYADPSVVGVSAPVGSLYVCTSLAKTWTKTGPADVDWTVGNSTSYVGAPNGETTTLPCGMPVASLSGQYRLASSASAALSVVVGLVSTSTAPTLFTPSIVSGQIVLATGQWDAITGQSGGLSPDAIYYLSSPWGMSTSPPIAGSLVELGKAISPTLFVVRIQRPILLA